MNGAYRWWENYLVRYLMPSIAGAAIVLWLTEGTCSDLKRLLLIDIKATDLHTSTLVLLFLYGNLFCYIASYPILSFHVTRSIDFDKGNWTHKAFRDGYILTFALGIITLISATLFTQFPLLKFIPFIAVTAFSYFQIARIRDGMKLVKISGVDGQVTQLFAYAHTLAHRRVATSSLWRKEFIDTYRHMREHGNSAFIFVLEIILAANCFIVLEAFKNDSAKFQLSLISILLVIWAVPAVAVHLLGQHIENRFSWYEKSLASANQPIPKKSRPAKEES